MSAQPVHVGDREDPGPLMSVEDALAHRWTDAERTNTFSSEDRIASYERLAAAVGLGAASVAWS